MNKGFSNITILIVVVTMVAIAGFLSLKKVGGPSTITQNQTPTNNTAETAQNNPSITTSNLCVTEKDKIIDLVNTFENLQMKREKGAAQSVLALFTPPESWDDPVYVHWSGSDAMVGPRLYSTG
jgi:hypothetical protein